jgi:hypothetical protein
MVWYLMESVSLINTHTFFLIQNNIVEEEYGWEDYISFVDLPEEKVLVSCYRPLLALVLLVAPITYCNHCTLTHLW